jgi:hypothetical protein
VFRADDLGAAPPRDRWLFAALVASVLVMPLSFVAHARVEHQVVVERMDPFTRARESGLRDALVLIGDRVGTTRSIGALDLTRNGIDYQGPVLYGLHIDTARQCPSGDLAVPNRQPYFYLWESGKASGTLSPLECGTSAARPDR